MKIDGYTKVVLTGIAILLGVIAFDYRPNMEAKAGIMGGGEMISAGGYEEFKFPGLEIFRSYVWQLKDGKIRICYKDVLGNNNPSPNPPTCLDWSKN
jgi:hypothetical protein